MPDFEIDKLDIAVLQKASILLQGMGRMIHANAPSSGKEAQAIGQHLHDMAVRATVSWARSEEHGEVRHHG